MTDYRGILSRKTNGAAMMNFWFSHAEIEDSMQLIRRTMKMTSRSGWGGSL